jgi:putative ABC transport system ATP-binding protein
MIHLENVTKQFDGARKVTALEGITLHVDRGEVVAIVGPSGSGKSTLLNLVGMLDRPTSGSIRVDDREIGSLGDGDLTRLRRDKIGFIFQFFNLLPSLSSVENVGLPLHLRGWTAQKVRQRAQELLDLVGLSNRLQHLPDELSGGERQRVAIARALACNPPILLADEPTGNLDSHTGAEILALLKDIQLKLGSTVLVVTHDSGVARSAARRLSLRDAHLVEDVRQ